MLVHMLVPLRPHMRSGYEFPPHSRIQGESTARKGRIYEVFTATSKLEESLRDSSGYEIPGAVSSAGTADTPSYEEPRGGALSLYQDSPGYVAPRESAPSTYQDTSGYVAPIGASGLTARVISDNQEVGGRQHPGSQSQQQQHTGNPQQPPTTGTPLRFDNIVNRRVLRPSIDSTGCASNSLEAPDSDKKVESAVPQPVVMRHAPGAGGRNDGHTGGLFGGSGGGKGDGGDRVSSLLSPRRLGLNGRGNFGRVSMQVRSVLGGAPGAHPEQLRELRIDVPLAQRSAEEQLVIEMPKAIREPLPPTESPNTLKTCGVGGY